MAENHLGAVGAVALPPSVRIVVLTAPKPEDQVLRICHDSNFDVLVFVLFTSVVILMLTACCDVFHDLRFEFLVLKLSRCRRLCFDGVARNGTFVISIDVKDDWTCLPAYQISQGISLS